MTCDDPMRRGLRLARRIGQILGGILIGVALFLIWHGIQHGDVLNLFQGLLLGTVGVLYVLPWLELNSSLWRKCFGALLIVTAVLAFTQVIAVMVTFAEAARQGIKPSPPIFQGVLLFLVLMQPPVILFERRPDWLE